ncbi:ABC transporter permease [Microbacteriaceae bacterium 4G12]
MVWWNTIRAELYKMRKTNMWLLLFLSPVLSGLLASATLSRFPDIKGWLGIYAFMTPIHAMLLLPLLTGVLTALVCRYEHLNGGWKQLLVQPLQRHQLYIVKFLLVILCIAIMQVLFTIALFIIGSVRGVTEPFPVKILLQHLIGGWIATFPLVALQLWVSTIWSSFAAPMALNVIFTLPCILISQSATYGPWYPWSQPLLAMLLQENMNIPSFTIKSLMIVVIGSFVIFLMGGLTTFKRKMY